MDVTLPRLGLFNLLKAQCYVEDDLLIVDSNSGTTEIEVSNKQTNKTNFTILQFRCLLCSLIVQTKSIYININDEKDPLKTELMEKNGHLSQNSKLYLSLAIEDHIQPAEIVSLLLHPRGPVRCLCVAVSGRVVSSSSQD